MSHDHSGCIHGKVAQEIPTYFDAPAVTEFEEFARAARFATRLSGVTQETTIRPNRSLIS